MTRRALVLGCGGVAGAAWSTAVLHALEQHLDFDLRESDFLVGTSAGALLAVLLAARVPVSELVASQEGNATSLNWNHDVDSGGALPPLPAFKPTAPAPFWDALIKHKQPLAAVAGLLPQGRMDMTAFRSLIDQFVPAGGWPSHPATWVVTADARQLQRTVFGRSDAPAAAARDAVCASYGVPGWCPPVTINGAQYIDGGVLSPTSADLLCREDVREVIVVAPMTAHEMDESWNPLIRAERRMRKYMTGILDRECEQLRSAGKHVVRLEPTAEDLKAFGFNMMDPRRRQRVYETACCTSTANVEQAFALSRTR